MEINAVAHLEYWSGESLFSGHERLDVNITFKEKGKFSKTKLSSSLVSTFSEQYTHDEFIEKANYYLDNYNEVVKEVEDMVKQYFEKIKQKEKEKNISNNLHKRTMDFGKIEVKVQIK
jgi:predicted phage tail protein